MSGLRVLRGVARGAYGVFGMERMRNILQGDLVAEAGFSGRGGAGFVFRVRECEENGMVVFEEERGREGPRVGRLMEQLSEFESIYLGDLRRPRPTCKTTQRSTLMRHFRCLSRVNSRILTSSNSKTARSISDNALAFPHPIPCNPMPSADKQSQTSLPRLPSSSNFPLPFSSHSSPPPTPIPTPPLPRWQLSLI
ncbi:hypothetical protein K458DRAFT_421369 [Lentithecium fluviatile CBS 122367]|uniref:Uncharacterized protein n=1 Tax=Lentithecium fluviatile CBS 122367 TaxID=1168545 RepID=A0A6G1IRU8_9PLEO|nr:hypothetical protein K458DRAFT_421369 [Lentithecium fluviatile CBS 122367]